MARRRVSPVDLLDATVYEQMCRDLQECDSIEMEIRLAEEAGVEGAANARQALADIRAANQSRIRVYFPGRPVPGIPRPDKSERR